MLKITFCFGEKTYLLGVTKRKQIFRNLVLAQDSVRVDLRRKHNQTDLG